MSEEEIVEKINLYLRHADVFFEMPGRKNVVKTIKALLNLYEKEKEKNNYLEIENKEIIDYSYKNDSLLDLYNKEKERNKELVAMIDTINKALLEEK